MSWSDFASTIWDCLRDDTSNLWQATNPGDFPLHHRLAIDQINLTYMSAVTMARMAGSKSAKFEPFYTYPGGPWDQKHRESLAPEGGYVRMSTSEADDWLAAKQQRQLNR